MVISSDKCCPKTGYLMTAATEIIKNVRETGSLEDRKKSGTPSKLTKDDNKYLKTLSLKKGFFDFF